MFIKPNSPDSKATTPKINGLLIGVMQFLVLIIVDLLVLNSGRETKNDSRLYLINEADLR